MDNVQLDIRNDVWHNVILRLLEDPPSLLALLQTCTALQNLADHEQVWQSVAAACWKHLAAAERISYRSFKELVLDDNRAHAAMAVPLRISCTYRFPHPTAFYQCQLLQLQWWRTTNSLRLYFDARGEPDLRLPMSSSIAVVQLKHQAAATPAPAPAAAAAATAAGGGDNDAPAPALQLPTAGSAPFDLDSWGTRLVVSAPDACQTFAQKPGHYKGVLIWHATKATQILKTLLQEEQEQEEGQHQAQGPPQQHTHQQRSRRSDAWEEWADWALEQQEEGQHDGGAGDVRGPAGHVSSLLRSCFSSLSSSGGSSSGSRRGEAGDAAPGSHAASSSNSGALHAEARCIVQAARAAPSKLAANSADGAGRRQQQRSTKAAPAKRCLVFCYANDLHWCRTMRTPDYSITPLVVADPQAVTPSSSSRGGSPSGSPKASSCLPTRHHMQQPGQQHTWRLQPLAGCEQLLTGREEGQLAAAWRRLPDAMMLPLGQLDQELQGEQQVQEQARWADLPPHIRTRGAAWWV